MNAREARAYALRVASDAVGQSRRILFGDLDAADLERVWRELQQLSAELNRRFLRTRAAVHRAEDRRAAELGARARKRRKRGAARAEDHATNHGEG